MIFWTQWTNGQLGCGIVLAIGKGYNFIEYFLVEETVREHVTA